MDNGGKYLLFFFLLPVFFFFLIFLFFFLSFVFPRQFEQYTSRIIGTFTILRIRFGYLLAVALLLAFASVGMDPGKDQEERV